MPKLRNICIALAAFTLLSLAGSGNAFAADPDQTAPQGEDPPGADNGAGAVAPPAQHDGVIPPPDIGDEGIHTDVPNPGAGHEKEVIPPPATQQDDPDAAPR